MLQCSISYGIRVLAGNPFTERILKTKLRIFIGFTPRKFNLYADISAVFLMFYRVKDMHRDTAVAIVFHTFLLFYIGKQVAYTGCHKILCKFGNLANGRDTKLVNMQKFQFVFYFLCYSHNIKFTPLPTCYRCKPKLKNNVKQQKLFSECN